MYILGIPYEIDQVTKEHALVWNQAWKSVEVKERSK